MEKREENIFVKVKDDGNIKSFTEKDIEEKTFKHFD